MRAERATSRALAGSCEVPLGAYAEVQTGKPREAERALREAARLNPNDPAASYALAVLFAQQQRYADALAAARRAAQLAPGDPQPHQLVQQLEARNRTGG